MSEHKDTFHHASRTFFILVMACLMSSTFVHAQSSPTLSYLLLDAMGAVRLVEEVRRGDPLVYDIASFGDSQQSFVDMEVSATDVFVLSSFGRVYSVSRGILVGQMETNLEIAIDLELDPLSEGFYILDHFGGVHGINGASSDWGQMPPYFSWDIARNFEITPDGKGYYLLDGFGAVHAVGSASPFRGVYFGWDIARDIELTSDSLGCCLMDGFGDVYLLTQQEPQALTSPPNLGWDIAKDLTLFRDERSFSVLDGFGNILSSGRMPSLSGFPLRWNAARSLEFLPSDRAARLIAPSAQTTVSLIPKSVHLPEWQDSVVLSVQVDNVFLLDEFDFSVSYDPTVLQPLLPEPAVHGEMLEPFESETRLVCTLEKPGVFSVKCVHFKDEGSPWLTGSGVLVALRFLPVQKGSSEVRIFGFRGTDSRTHGSAWRLKDPPPAAVTVTSRPMTARIQRKPVTRRARARGTSAGNPRFAVAQVMLLDATSAHGVRFDLEYDHHTLQLEALREGPLLSNFGTTVALFDSLSLGRESGILPDQGVTLLGRDLVAKGTGCVMEMDFLSTSRVPGAVKLKRFQVFDKSGQIRDIEITNAIVEMVP